LKKLIAILLASSLLLNIIGYQLIFHLRKAELKAEMKKFLRLQPRFEDQTVFIFSLDNKKAIAQLEWEGDDEFMLRGEMYDVIEKKIADGKLIIRCISDEKETSLIKKYEALNNDMNGNSPQSRSITLLKLFNSFYLPVANSFCFASVIILPQQSLSLYNNTSAGHKEILTPPPQIL
jgi:hypothetical protein